MSEEKTEAKKPELKGDPVLVDTGPKEWKGLHGPVTYLGDTLYSDDPHVMARYWKAFVRKGEGFRGFLASFPALRHENADAIRGKKKPFVFVHIKGELMGWRPKELSPSVEDLRGPNGKEHAIGWLNSQGFQD